MAVTNLVGQPNPARAGSIERNTSISRVIIWAILVLGAILFISPFIWMVSSSLKEEQAVFTYPPQLIPDPVMWSNYVQALTYKPFATYIFNTLIIVVLNEFAILLSASFVAYGFARIQFKGRDFWFAIVLASMMIPYAVLMIPQFVMFTRLGWIDTRLYLPLTIPVFFGGGGFNIFLLRQFFKGIPLDLADAARVDGCSEFGIYWRIMMPLAKPALATIAIFTFLGTWNDFLGPLLYIKSPEYFTVSIGLAAFRGVMRTRWDLLMAASTAMILPAIIIFFSAQRYFIEGAAISGLKG